MPASTIESVSLTEISLGLRKTFASVSYNKYPEPYVDSGGPALIGLASFPRRAGQDVFPPFATNVLLSPNKPWTKIKAFLLVPGVCCSNLAIAGGVARRVAVIRTRTDGSGPLRSPQKRRICANNQLGKMCFGWTVMLRTSPANAVQCGTQHIGVYRPTCALLDDHKAMAIVW